MKARKSIILFLIVAAFFANAQDPTRFKEQVEELAKKEYNFDTNKKLVVFTGSSSIRMWDDVADYFPGFNVINNGFGGSHFSDLLYYYNELIVRQKPDIIFIYEGDNDIASLKEPKKILKEARLLTRKIKNDLPASKIVFISPKPSIARVHLKNGYIIFNKKLKKYCNKHNNVDFADVWNPMLDNKGNVYKDIFLEDGLHMNKKGYNIWAKVISGFLKE